MNLKQALSWATQELQVKKIKTASLDAEVLLSFVLKKPKEFIYTHPKTKLTLNQIKKLKNLINRRSKNEPAAYLTNHKEFYGLDFYVDKRVLIPRPETELLVEEIIKKTKKQENKKTRLFIADIGTGSGCIAITLAKLLPKAKIYATDICKKALKVAAKNAKIHRVKIKFFQGNLLEPIKNKKINVLVANLPYLEDNYQKRLPAKQISSLKFEPKIALAGNIKIYQRLFKQISQLENKPKYLICETGPDSVTKLKNLVKKLLPQAKLEIKKDLAGLNRILIIKN